MHVQRRTDEIIREALHVIKVQVSGMWRYRWLSIGIAWFACLIGWASVYRMPDVFAANARVYVDTENAIEDFLGGIAAPTDVMNEVNLVVREIVSRPNLAEVARNTDLALRASNNSEFQDLLTSLGRRIRVDGNRDGVYTISFQDADRETALAVVDNVLTTFVERSLGADRTDSEQAQRFLQDQIGDYEERLTLAENRLADFKRDNVAFMPDQQGDYFSRMQAAEIQLQLIDGKLKLAEERRAELMRQIEGEAPVFGIMSPNRTSPSIGGSGTSAKIRELELQVEELRLQYTDRHPRIGQLLDTIEILKKREAEEVAQLRQEVNDQPLAQNPLDLNPVYQNMRIQLTNVEVEIASLRAERDQQQAEVTELRTMVDTIPQVEAELSRLNRDYDVIRAKHQQLLQQLETASIGEDVSQSIDEIQFRIIDPPFSEFRPVGPNRPILLTGVLVIAVAMAIAAAFLLNQLNPTFVGHRSVSEVLGIPVLASVSLLQTDREMRAEQRGKFMLQAAIVGLLLCFSAAVYLADFGSLVFRNLLASLT